MNIHFLYFHKVISNLQKRKEVISELIQSRLQQESQCLTKQFFPPAGFYSPAQCGAGLRSAVAEVTNGHCLMQLPYKESTCGVKTFLKGPATPLPLINALVNYHL